LIAAASVLGVTLDPGPLLFSCDPDYKLIFEIVVEKADKMREVMDQAFANRIANSMQGYE
jgi:DNA primase